MSHNHNIDHLDFNFRAAANDLEREEDAPEVATSYIIGHEVQGGEFITLCMIDNAFNHLTDADFIALRDELISTYQQFLPVETIIARIYGTVNGKAII